MKVLSLFSGGGLGDFGLMAAGMEIAGQVEIDPYCQKILALRYPDSIKWTDIRGVTGEQVKEKIGAVDVVAGGFPCQPFSVAGNQRGDKDDRHLWPEMLRVISEVKPTWVIGENVPGIIGIALDDVLNDLEMAGYECGTFVFSAHALGAWHRRERVWIVGRTRLLGQAKHEKQAAGTEQSGKKENLANTSNARTKEVRERKIPTNEDIPNSNSGGRALWRDGELPTITQNERRRNNNRGRTPKYEPRKWWETEPTVGRVADGIARRVDRLKMLGNGQVPACTKFIGERIMEFENAT